MTKCTITVHEGLNVIALSDQKLKVNKGGSLALERIIFGLTNTINDRGSEIGVWKHPELSQSGKNIKQSFHNNLR